MTADLHDLLARLQRLQVSLWDDDGHLGFDAPEGALGPELLAELRARKDDLLALLRRGQDAAEHQQLRPQPHTGTVPLSPAQRGLWAISGQAGGSVAYNVPYVTRLTGALDVAALARSLEQVVHRHESLRTTFHLGDDGPVQRIHPPSALALPIDDLGDVPPGAREAELARRVDREVHQAFDLERGPLVRVRLIRLAADVHVLCVVVHHIVGDGWSLAVLSREVSALYAAFVAGSSSPLPPLPLQYADFGRWHAERLAGGAAERHLEYWRRTLADVTPLQLPTDRPRPHAAAFRGELLVHSLDASLTRALRAAAKSEGASLHDVLFAAFQVLLARVSGQVDFAVASGTLGRRHPALEPLIGHFFNIAMIRCDLADDPSFAELLARVRRDLLAAGEHEDLPFERVVESLRPERVAGQNPLAQVALSLEKYSAGGLALPGVVATREPLRFRAAKLDLALWISELDTGLEISAEYNSDLFDAATLATLIARYERLLRDVLGDRGRRVSRLALVSEAERAALIAGAGASTIAPPRLRVDQQFAAQARLAPDAPALVDLCSGGRAWTYAALDRRADAIAARLRALGVGPGVLVAVCLERSADLVAALLATLRAGGAFVVLDPELPSQRLAFMLADTAAATLVSRAALQASLPASAANLVDLDDALPDAAPIDGGAGSDDLAYVLYTSGSTGAPNGVLVEHAGLANAIQAHVDIMSTGPGTRHAHVLSFNFDGALAHLFVMICAGGTVYLAPRDGAFLADGLAALIDREAITHTCLPPTMLAALPDAPLPSLHTLVVAGERCSAALVDRWGRGRRMLNLYGPTEASILATHARCVADGEPPPIGRPIAGTRAYVLDRWGGLAAPGAVGELALAGVGVARGYLNRPALTARKFVTDPFVGGRLYRTGDLVRLRTRPGADAPSLEFLGRIDAQVKIRGHRIEPAEIEHALRGLADVGDAVVTVFTADDAAAARLVAYVSPRRADVETAGLGERLQAELRATLPAPLVPSTIVVLPALPFTLSGKVDLRALPRPDVGAAAPAEPRSDVERLLVDIWCAALGRERVGIHDNFFALGGDSVLGIQVVARAQERGVGLRAGQLFEHQTIAELAAAAGELGLTGEVEAHGPAPLTPIQRWFFAQDIPHGHFNQAILLEVPAALDAAHLAAALGHVQADHAALRLRFTRGADGWSQTVLTDAAVGPPPLEVLDVADVAELPAIAARLHASLDITRGPIQRAALIRLGAGARVLWVIHHLAVDAVSWRILVPDLATALRQLAADEPVVVPRPTTSFKQWATRLHALAAADPFTGERAALLASPPRPLPVDHPDGADDRAVAATVHVRLDAATTRSLLRDALRPYNLAAQDILLTALVQAVARWTGETAAWVDLEGHGREDLFPDVDLSRTVGWFTALYPVRLALPADDDPGDALVAIKDQLRAVPRRGLGFGLLRHLHPEGPGLAWPAPAIAFNYVGQLNARSLEDPATGIRLAREDAGPGLPAHGRRAHEIEANGVVRGGVLEFGFTFSRARMDETTVARLADDFIAGVAALVRHCLSAVGAWSPGDFPLVALSHKELRGLLARVGETGRARVAAIHPVTALQKGLLYHALQAETAGAYGTQVVLSLTGTLDPVAFHAAWQQLVRRHEALRSGFHWDGLAEPVQVVLLTAEVTLHALDWQDAPDAPARLGRLYSELAARPLSLHDAPIMRVTLVRTAADRHVLIWDSHHILMDGWSMSVLLRDLHAAYRAARSGQALASPTPPSYAAYLRWLARQDHAAAAAAWRAAMHGFAGPTPLPGERTSPGAHALRQIDLRLPADLTAALGAATDAARVTMASALAGAWACVLARSASHSDVLFGTVVSGRDAAVPGIESMLGLFIHMLPVRVQVDDDAEVWPWLRALQAQQAAARAHQTTPLAEIQSFTEVPAGTPLFRSVLVYQDYPFDAALFSDGELSIGFVRADDPTHYPLVVTAIPGPELHLSFEYDEAWFEPGAAERLAGQLEATLRGLIDAADARVAALTTLTPDERTRVLAELDNTTRDTTPDRGATIHGLFAAQAARTPDAPAVYHGDRVVSYAALERRANRLARHLQRRGVGVETRVGVCLDRTDELIVALLAVLKAGGAYVPIDPAYPLARQALMAEDAGAALVITGRGLAARFIADRSRLVNLDADADAIAREGDAGLAPGQPERLAYIIYTSGSTGQPKGVAIEHRSSVAMLQAARAMYSEADLRVVSACASICFDYSILEIFLPLIVGGAVVLVDDALALPAAPARDRVRLLSLVPSAMTELHRAGSIPAGVRAINLAGERLGREVVDRAYGLPHVERVYNIYGPTETTTFSTYALVARDARDEPTLGRPIAGTRVYLLDRRMRPVPFGAPGELWIGGAGVARGYWNRPALTAERFVDDPFGPGRIYRTGDLGRLRPNGEIAYLGRIDDQIKLRGFRVELGEIEAALARIPGVERAVVVADGDPPQRLVAHWVAAPGAALAAGDLRARLAESLPAFMVPEIYVRRDELPLTASGKVDRRALPRPAEADVRQDAFTPPETPLEQALAQIWQEVLDVPRVGADDNFFRLGGHSLLALTMVMRVEAELDRTISIATLFQAPTLRALARTLDVPAADPSPGPAASPLLLPIQPHGARPPVFCVGGFGVHASYLHPLGPALGDDQPLYAIQPLDISAEHPEIASMEALAEHLADVVQSVQPAGPYTLSGHSAGARLALAIGFVLEARGHRTATVVLDMHAPVIGGASQDKWSAGDDDLLGYIRQMKVVLGEALSVDIEATAQMPDDQAWAHIAAILERERLLPPGGGVPMLQRTILLRRRVFTLLADYVPTTPYPGRLVLLSVADRHRAGLPRISAAAWQDYCARLVEPFLVPGDHLTMVRAPHVAVVAAHLRRVVDEMVDEMRLPALQAADTVGGVTDPASAFPVTWDDPDDARAMWLFDAAHSAAPMSRLDFELRMAPMTDGTNRANVLYGLPLSSEPRLINAFVYQKANAPDIAPDAADAVWQGADAAMRRGAEGLAERWTGAWLPEIQRHLADLHAVDLGAASLPGLVQHLADLRRRVVRLWEIHFELMYPLTLALSDFDDAYRDLFPGAKQLEVYELLAGFPSKTTEANLRLWELGRAAARSPELRATITATDAHDLPAALAATPAGQQLWSDLQDYMRVYGERSDDLYIDRPGWLEQPTPILRGLQEAVRQPDRDLAAELRGQTERREARLAAVRAALADHPRPVVAEFESLLAAAQASTHLGEEHNFWIDAKITFHARRAALEVGRRLAARGAVDDPEDVFQLSLAELQRAAADPTSTFHGTVAERRAEAARFAGTSPPRVLGVMRPFLPMDSALMRAMFRMNGDQLSPPPKDGSLSGMPGSGGKVTGPARVVRTLAEAGKLRPGDVLVATSTLPSWTPYFAIASAVVTNTGGMLCHAAVVAREYGIPAVVGTRSATETLHDGQQVEVDGDAGTVRVVA